MDRIHLPSGTPAELARPDHDDRAYGLVIAPDIWGLRPLFDDLVARLSAEQVWSVVAVEPFPGRTFPAGDIEARFGVMPEMQDDRVLGDLVDAASVLATTKVACLGFCMGGMYALKAASTGAFSRVCAFYGHIRVPEAWRGSGQSEPLDLLGAVRTASSGGEQWTTATTRVMAVIGGQDPATPPDDVAALRAAGVDVQLYPDAGHGFVHDPSRPAHRPADAADAWGKALAFLGR